MQMKKIADDEFHTAFSSLKSNKLSGYDDISLTFIKTISNEAFSIIKHLFNISLQQGAFPDKLKIPCVTPIFKNLDKSLLASYLRPTSALPCFLKSLERVIYTYCNKK